VILGAEQRAISDLDDNRAPLKVTFNFISTTRKPATTQSSQQLLAVAQL